ncbi:MAG: hypothetical protein LKM38_02335 [Pseudomonas veronii]|jgi:hypothetical protein|nr:hypothetical protein [Pseudomonas veronii]
MSLSLPDICSKLEAANNKTSGVKYAAWFDEYMMNKYSFQHPLMNGRTIFMDGDSCYALRCSMLHQGDADLTTQKVRSFLDSIHFTTTTGHCNRVNGVLQLDVSAFCTDVCNSVAEWHERFKTKDGAQDKLRNLFLVHVSESSILGGSVVFGSSS